MSAPCNHEANPSLCDRRIKITSPNGSIESFPALDSRWCLKAKFESYIGLMSSYGRIKTGAALEEWQYKANRFQNNLEQLLALHHNEFWSTLLYHNDVISAIVKFLQRATPFYRLVSDSDSEQDLMTNPALRQYKLLLSLVVRVVFRLLTQQESSEDWMTPEQHGGFLYNNFLISVPMLFDLTIALGNSNRNNVALLKKLFGSVLDIQPKYQMDIQYGLQSFEKIFTKIQAQVDNGEFKSSGGGRAFSEDGAQTPYDDIVLFTLDCAYTLGTLLDVCPQIMLYCAESKLPLSIAHFYDNTLPLLYKYIHTVNPNADSLVWLNEARQKFVDAFRSIAIYFLESALESPAAKTEHNLIAMLTECLSAQSFVVDYQRQHPVKYDMDILQQACERLKDHKIEFIISGYEKAVASDPAGTMGDHYFRNYLRAHSTESDEGPTAQPVAVNEVVGNDKVVSTDVRDIDLDVSKVLDVLPDLGIGFIRRLLERCDNSEEAIAAILDNNLPPDLMNSDRNEVYIPPDPQDQMFQRTGLSHINVHDGDAFDVMTQDNPKCIIKKGKGFPGAAVNAEQLLDDKTELKELKERYQQYSLVEDTIDEYDDEYDDSYEAMIEGQPQPLHKTKELKTTLSEASSRISESEDSDDNTTRDDDKQSSQQRDKRNDFCENPEDIRARYMARQLAKRGQKVGGQQPTRDVVGAAKGQGQSKEILRNREHKEANKSSRANHNRKSGASFKRSRGMIP